MTSRLPEPPIFNYLNVVQRHRSERFDPGARPTVERRELVDSFVDLDGVVGGDTCWSGWCPGCGRTLISATTPQQQRPDSFFCTAECRAEHEAKP